MLSRNLSDIEISTYCCMLCVISCLFNSFSLSTSRYSCSMIWLTSYSQSNLLSLRALMTAAVAFSCSSLRYFLFSSYLALSDLWCEYLLESLLVVSLTLQSSIGSVNLNWSNLFWLFLYLKSAYSWRMRSRLASAWWSLSVPLASKSWKL